MSIKVTMGLTERDVENTDYIYSVTDARTKAQAVSIALSLTRYLIDQKIKGNDLVVRNDRGDFERVVMMELERLNDERAASEKLRK